MEPTVSRVLMTGDSVGGVWTYALDLSRALGDLGIEVVLAIMGRPVTPQQHREAWGIDTLTIVEGPYKLEWMEDPWSDVARARAWLLELEQRHAPDVIHLNGYAYASAPFRAPTLVVAHSCVLSWWQAVKGEPAPREWDRYRDEVRAGIRAADSLVSPTQAMLAAIIEHYGPIAHGRVIANGTDLGRYAPDLKEPLIFSAGRLWDAAKNVHALAEIAPRLPWPVYVAGDDQRPPGAREAHSEPPQVVHALGRLSRGEMASWLGRAAIYALPARYEPFGLSVLEAAASGCALILGDIPSLRELWDGAATFVTPSCPDALASAAERLIADASLRSQLADAAAVRAEAFGLHQLGQAYVEHYGSMLAARQGTRSRAPETTTSAAVR